MRNIYYALSESNFAFYWDAFWKMYFSSDIFKKKKKKSGRGEEGGGRSRRFVSFNRFPNILIRSIFAHVSFSRKKGKKLSKA